jgi:hypothetical protein
MILLTCGTKDCESRFATGYNSDAKPYINAKNKTANAADDLHTTVADYGIFLQVF